MNISGSIALVTGANRGLGRVFADQLIQRGASKVYLGARNVSSLEILQNTHGSRVVPVPLDVTSDAQVQAAANLAADVTLVVNNAGILKKTGLLQAGTLEPLQEELDVNLFGIARMTLAFADILKANGGGAFLNVLSVASLHGFAPFGTYCISKAAAMSLTQSLRYELRDQGTSVHGVYAGFIATDMTAGIAADMATPEDIVITSLDGLEGGILDINADDRSVAVRALLQDEDPGTIQQAYFDRADAFYDTHGRQEP